MKNMFCNLRDLKNEASVEALFVDRLLNMLKYPDNRVRRKESIKEVVIGKGRKKEKYKPDYVLFDSSGLPKIVLDAKGPNETLENYHYQVSGYALHLNQEYTEGNPVLYTSLTNGHCFLVYPWDRAEPVFFLRFEDFVDGNEKFLELRSNLSYSAFNQVAATKGVFDFQRPAINTIKSLFNECHNLIWKKEKIPPTDAFYEFCKIMFIKLRRDSNIHSIIGKHQKPKISDFVFSTKWINEQAEVELNPVDAILFRHIQEELERQIRQKKKKRIFEVNEQLKLKASTTYEVVKRLQNYDLYGIDEDLNGRMFETFLKATVRGKDLGQFFTPRGVVHYMVETAPIFVSTDKRKQLSERIPYILDGCCGSGGFLIDAMARFAREIGNISYLTDKEREIYIEEIKNNHLFGIEANDKIARISRLNMYLHGDGGSKIFKADTLDRELSLESGMNEEEQEGLEELKRYLINGKLRFDIILTNPPFSMKYKSSDKHEKKILQQYRITKAPSGKVSSSEKSNVLFIERYWDLLKTGSGELLTVIDDSVLNGENSQKYRNFLLENFIIIQVISLPFNTFYPAGAGVKTSILHLRKRTVNEQQGSIFMAITNNIGHDDHGRDSPERNNLRLVAEIFEEWKKGRAINGRIIHNEHPREPLGAPLQIFELPKDKINPERLDAFYYAPELRNAQRALLKLQREGKMSICRGSDFIVIQELKKADTWDFTGKKFKYFEIGDVTIDGTIVEYREDYFANLPTRAKLMVRKGDVIFAKNISSRGTTVIIPDWFDGGLVTTGFIGIRPANHEEALILWNAFESEFFRKQIYYLAITATQPEVRENIFRAEMMIPWPKTQDKRDEIAANARSAESARHKLRCALENTTRTIDNLLKEV